MIVTKTNPAKNKTISWPELAAYFGAILAIVLFASMNVFVPLTGDTALFLVGAEAMHQGATLYVDFWDNKQPGIFAFYYLAGVVFGFSQEGVRAFEILWWLAFSIISFMTLRRYFNHKWLSAAVPVVFLSVYYAHLTPWIAAQLEVLVGFPIFVSVLLLARPYRSGGGAVRGFAFAGVFAGISVAFKLALAPMFVVFVLIATVEHARHTRSGETYQFVIGLWLGFALGVVLVLAAICLAFLGAGALDQLIWTTFVYPPRALAASEGAPLGRLAGSLSWYAAVFAPWIPFVALAARKSSRTDTTALNRLMWAWLIAGMAVILVQRFSWWTYHTPLLFVPTAVLAVLGIDGILIWLRERANAGPRPRTFASILLFLPALAATAVPMREKAEWLLDAHRNPDTGPAGFRSHYEEYQQAVYKARVVNEDDALPGKIYVFGSPLIYVLSNRQQALPTSGWAWGIYLPEQWRTLPDDLIRYRPVYIYVSSRDRWFIDKHNPEVWPVLDKYYSLVEELEEGDWYRLVAPHVVPLMPTVVGSV